jgi:hypothetical protein
LNGRPGVLSLVDSYGAASCRSILRLKLTEADIQRGDPSKQIFLDCFWNDIIASRMQGGVPVEGQGLRSSLMPYLGGGR